MRETYGGGDVVDDNGGVSGTVVHRGERLVTFLSGRVPDLRKCGLVSRYRPPVCITSFLVKRKRGNRREEKATHLELDKVAARYRDGLGEEGSAWRVAREPSRE